MQKKGIIYLIILLILILHPVNTHTGAPDIELLSFLAIGDETFSNGDSSMYFFLQDGARCYFSVQDLQNKYSFEFFAENELYDNGWYKCNIKILIDKAQVIGLSKNDLGFLATPKTNRIGTGQVIPLKIAGSNERAEILKYSFILKSRDDLAGIKCEIYRSDSRSLVNEKELRYIPRSTPIAINIDFSDVAKGEYILVIRGRLKGRLGGPTRTYRFYHDPRIENIKEIELKWHQIKIKKI